MENKKTTELIDLLEKLVDKDGSLLDGYEEAYEELRKRSPFNLILKDEYESGESLEEITEKLVDDIKLLKRHKHDERNGDVLIRI